MTRAIVDCATADCLSGELDGNGLSPDYLYVPKDRITGQGIDRIQPPELRQSIRDSDRFRIAHENEKAMIVAVNSSGEN